MVFRLIIPWMPEEIFDALELASLKGEETTMVNKAQFDKMVADYEIKMSCAK